MYIYIYMYVQASANTAATKASTRVNNLYSQAATAAKEDAFSRKAVAASMPATFRYHEDIS